MSKDESPAAFPLGANEYGGHGSQAGMTLRDYFAAKILQSLIASHRQGGWNLGANGRDNEHISVAAYAVADAMLEARKT